MASRSKTHLHVFEYFIFRVRSSIKRYTTHEREKEKKKFNLLNRQNNKIIILIIRFLHLLGAVGRATHPLASLDHLEQLLDVGNRRIRSATERHDLPKEHTERPPGHESVKDFLSRTTLIRSNDSN